MAKIGWIGAGDMGRPMAQRLQASGHDVTVCDSRPAVLVELADSGIVGVARPESLAANDIVVVMVASDAQVLDVIGGDAGLAGAIDRDRPPLVLVMSTCLPRTMLAVRDLLQPGGARLLDAPVSGGRTKAQDGSLSIMVAGEPADIAAVSPLLEQMGSEIFECGPLGAAQTVKLLNNMVSLTNLFLGAEVIEVSQRAGIPLPRLLAILEASSGRNVISSGIGRAVGLYGGWTATPEIFASLASITRKDLQNACDVAADAGVDAWVFNRMRETFADPRAADLDRWRAMAERCRREAEAAAEGT